MKLAILSSHPIQYYAPLFRQLARHVDLTVIYAHRDNQADQARAGFGVGFAWDVDLLSGYRSEFLVNAAKSPGLGRFAGVDTPGIGKRLREGRFDALLLTGWYLKCFHQALFAAKRLRLQVMVRGDSHLDTPRSPLKVALKNTAYPLFLRLFDAALYVGERNRTYWRHYGYPEERLFHSPHCVDNAWFSARATVAARAEIRGRFGIGSDTRVVLFAGKLVAFKRPLDVAAAVGKLRRTGLEVEMLVAGAGELEATLLEAAVAEGVKLHMLGFCNQTEMPKAYAACDVLVLPSDGRETWGLVVNEALACGRPAVVSDAVGCAPDLAKLLGAGAVFRTGDSDDLARAISEMLTASWGGKINNASGQFSLEAAAAGILSAAEYVANRSESNVRRASP